MGEIGPIRAAPQPVRCPGRRRRPGRPPRRCGRPTPGAGGDHGARRHGAAVACGVTQPRRQHEGRVGERMAAAMLGGRLRADRDQAALRCPVARRERHPVGQHQRAVRLQVGQLGQRGRIAAVGPARVDDFDRHAHRIDQRRGGRNIERRGKRRIDIAAQPQRDLGLDAAELERPVACVGRTRPHAGWRQRRMRQHGIARRSAGLPVPRHSVAEPAERLGDTVLHGIGGAGVGQWHGGRGLAGLSRVYQGLHGRGDGIHGVLSGWVQSSGQRSAQGATAS